MTNLGTLGGSSNTFAVDVNASGQVVGSSATTDGATHAFAWTAEGGMVDLDTIGGSAAVAINDSGQVIGQSVDGSIRSFFWTAARGMVDLGTLGGYHTAAWAINASGQVVRSSAITGDLNQAGFVQHAFSWTAAGGMIDLGTLGSDFSEALAINNNRIVVGESSLADGTVHATLWQLSRPPVCSRARPDVPVLWPPNHKLVPIQIVGILDPANRPVTIMVTAVTESEPMNGRGDGNTSPDAVLGENGSSFLRAERAGGGNGRVYRVQFTADNGLNQRSVHRPRFRQRAQKHEVRQAPSLTTASVRFDRR